MLILYRGPLSISLDLFEENEVYIKLSVLDSCELAKRRICQENVELDLKLGAVRTSDGPGGFRARDYEAGGLP